MIGMFVWELPAVPPSWREGANFVHEIWAPSSFCAGAFEALAPGRPMFVEEVLRLEVFDPIPSELPAAPAGRGLTASQRRRRAVGIALASAGYTEVLPSPFTASAVWDALGLRQDDSRRRTLTLLNPLDTDRAELQADLRAQVDELANLVGDVVELARDDPPEVAGIPHATLNDTGRTHELIRGMRKLIEYGIERGEIRNARLADFPQIVIAPAMVAVMWQGLFGRHAPLDAVAMLKVHLDLIFGERRAS